MYVTVIVVLEFYSLLINVFSTIFISYIRSLFYLVLVLFIFQLGVFIFNLVFFIYFISILFHFF